MVSLEVSFHMPGLTRPVVPGTKLWNTPLSPGTAARQTGGQMTVGDYFQAARSFLTQDQGSRLCRAIKALAGECGPVPALGISLEKHGAFYHPLKISIEIGKGLPVYLVLNGAVKDPGAALIHKEHQLLASLASRIKPSFLPRVFGAETITCDKGRVCFFLGQWFDGFCEFHVTQTPEGNQVAVWQDDGIHETIPWEQAARIYQRIAYILTAYYDVHTGHEIGPWHHAAGDFVVSLTKEGTAVRLITVRGMGPLTQMAAQPSDPGVRQLFHLLVFFLNLTVRIRLDRLDGIGPMVFLPEIVLDATVKGMFQALEDRERGRLGETDSTRVPAALSCAFIEFATRFDAAQLVQVIAALLEDWQSGEAELALVQKNLVAHCSRVNRILTRR
jgi:hypothetical protein